MYPSILKPSTTKCSDLPELSPELIESKLVASHSRKASDSAVRTDQLIKPQTFKNELDW